MFSFLNGVQVVIFFFRYFYVEYCKIIKRIKYFIFIVWLRYYWKPWYPKFSEIIFLLVSEMFHHYTDNADNLAPVQDHFLIYFFLFSKLIREWQALRQVAFLTSPPLYSYIFKFRTNSFSSPFSCTWKDFYVICFGKCGRGRGGLGVICLHLGKKMLSKGLQKTLTPLTN